MVGGECECMERLRESYTPTDDHNDHEVADDLISGPGLAHMHIVSNKYSSHNVHVLTVRIIICEEVGCSSFI